MSGAAPRRRRWRNGAVGASIAAHILVFALIGLNVPKPVYRQPPPLQTTDIWLMPHPTPRSHDANARQVHTSATAALPAMSKADLAKPTTPGAPPASPSAPPPQSSLAPGAGPGPPAQAQYGGGTDFKDGVRGALRAGIGCDAGRLAHLTPEEKDRCNQRIGAEAHKGPAFIDTIPPEKRVYYDAVQQAYKAAHDPMHPLVRDRYGNVEPWGKGPGIGCGMKFGGPPQPPDHRSLTDKIKAIGLLGVDLGPLKCGIVIPQGSMTPEIGIPTP